MLLRLRRPSWHVLSDSRLLWKILVRDMPKICKKPAARNRGRQNEKRCPCCAGVHSLVACKMPGAKELLKHRRANAVGSKKKNQRKKTRNSAAKSPSFREKACAAYSKRQPSADAEAYKAKRRKMRKSEDLQEGRCLDTPANALAELQNAGFLCKPHCEKSSDHRVAAACLGHIGMFFFACLASVLSRLLLMWCGFFVGLGLSRNFAAFPRCSGVHAQTVGTATSTDVRIAIAGIALAFCMARPGKA